MGSKIRQPKFGTNLSTVFSIWSKMSESLLVCLHELIMKAQANCYYYHMIIQSATAKEGIALLKRNTASKLGLALHISRRI
jgi:hypothetical protein